MNGSSTLVASVGGGVGHANPGDLPHWEWLTQQSIDLCLISHRLRLR